MPKPRRRPRHQPPITLLVRLDAAAAAVDTPDPVWVQIATEGEYLGYRDGAMPFEFTAQTFAQVVANLRAHPNYVRGPDGYGIEGVVAWDFNHASEHDATAGSLPQLGAPAQGWALDFEVRQGADGKAQLWSLTRWLEPLRTYIREKRYQWASVSLLFDAIDPVSGKNVGAIITSVAATNTPFIEGMNPLAATRGEGGVQARYWGEMADDPQDAFEQIRDVLDLPATDGVAEVAAEVAKLQAWSAANDAPAGIDLGDIIGNFRQILNMPTLSAAAEVFTQIADLLAIVTTPGVGTALDGRRPHIAAQGADQMDVKILASKLGVKADDGAVADAIDALADLDKRVRAGLQLGDASARKTADAVQVALDNGATAAAQLASILEKVGVKNAGDVMGRITDLMSTAAQLAELMPKLQGLETQVAEQQAAQQTQDIQQTIASHFGGDEKHRKMLLSFHISAGRDEFLAAYPAVSPEQIELTRSITGGGDAGANRDTASNDAVVIDLANYAGNRTQRLMSFVAAQPGGDKLSFDERHDRACKINAAAAAAKPSVKIAGL